MRLAALLLILLPFLAACAQVFPDESETQGSAGGSSTLSQAALDVNEVQARAEACLRIFRTTGPTQQAVIQCDEMRAAMQDRLPGIDAAVRTADASDGKDAALVQEIRTRRASLQNTLASLRQETQACIGLLQAEANDPNLNARRCVQQ